jgi:hypothetical protein
MNYIIFFPDELRAETLSIYGNNFIMYTAGMNTRVYRRNWNGVCLSGILPHRTVFLPRKIPGGKNVVF